MNPTLWLVACAIGLCVLGALAVVYRRAAAERELELADELLDEELRAAAERAEKAVGVRGGSS